MHLMTAHYRQRTIEHSVVMSLVARNLIYLALNLCCRVPTAVQTQFGFVSSIMLANFAGVSSAGFTAALCGLHKLLSSKTVNTALDKPLN